MFLIIFLFSNLPEKYFRLASLFTWCRSHNRIIFDIYYVQGDEKCVHKLVINNLLYSIAHITVVRYDLWRSLSHSKWTHFYAHSNGCAIEKQLGAAFVQLDEKFKEQKNPRQLRKHENLFHFLLLLRRAMRCWAETRSLFFFLFIVECRSCSVINLCKSSRRKNNVGNEMLNEILFNGRGISVAICFYFNTRCQ